MSIALRSYKLVIGLIVLLGLTGIIEVFLNSSLNTSNDGNSKLDPKPITSPGHDGDNGRGDNGGHDDESLPFCSVVNPITGSFIDLSWLSSNPNESPNGGDRNRQDQSKTRWLVKGWEYNTNFTLGICSSSVGKELEDKLSDTTGAYYVDHNKPDHFISIGEYSSKPRFTGKKLTLTYENGDTCPNGVDKKSTLINFICDKEVPTKAQVSFVGQLHNCSYFFEVRSVHACPISNVGNDINAVGIFASIVIVFLLIEIMRRVVYELLVVERRRHIDMDNMDEVVRWANAEQEPLWKRVLKGIPLFSEKRNSRQAVRLRTRENTALSIDMEQQNELLDSLDVDADADADSTD